jgi:coenzyme F420-0:L-glutamate ligase/coenzyme F420-1:gamma-L-glutamate ligase
MEIPTLILTALGGIPLIQQGDNLGVILDRVLEANRITLANKDILVITQKIISKSEGRLIDLKDVSVSPEAEKLARKTEKDPRLVELILSESRRVVRSRPGLIIVEHKLGFICANAGIDRSNIAEDGGQSVLLLPEDPDLSARKLRNYFLENKGIEIGVLIIDSHGRAWRNGTVGISIGFSGLPGLVDLRGEDDLFDYELQATVVAAADELAAGASLLMGQASEGTPVVHARGFPYPLREGSFDELPREESSDLFR